jgi:hypothetical protein
VEWRHRLPLCRLILATSTKEASKTEDCPCDVLDLQTRSILSSLLEFFWLLRVIVFPSFLLELDAACLEGVSITRIQTDIFPVIFQDQYRGSFLVASVNDAAVAIR